MTVPQKRGQQSFRGITLVLSAPPNKPTPPVAASLKPPLKSKDGRSLKRPPIPPPDQGELRALEAEPPRLVRVAVSPHPPEPFS